MFNGMLATFEIKGGPVPMSKTPGFLLSDILAILGVGILLFLLLVLWAAYVRKPKRRRMAGRKVLVEKAEEVGAEVEKLPSETQKDRYKYRMRRREHRGRNPTLAETGGLPPVRSEEERKITL